MSGSGNLINPRATPLYGNTVQKRPLKKEKGDENQNFQQMVSDLQNQTEGEEVKLSSHAQERIKSRKIDMDEKRLESLGEVAKEAKSKGARNTLAMFGTDAFILSVKDKTVVTAMKEEEMESRFFTNIDSVYIKK